MTTLKDRIHDVIVEYEEESNQGVAIDFQAIESSIMEVIKDYLINIID